MTPGLQRTFVAVDLDPGLREAVVTLGRSLEAAGARLKWIRPESLHFTLKFLGEITAAQVVRVRKATRETAAEVGPFPITLESVGVFPNARRPQVLWLGVGKGRDRLETLAARLEEHLVRQRFPAEPRRFQPHLTLARIRDPQAAGSLAGALESLRGVSPGSQVVEAMIVYESRLGPAGARYEPLEEVPLGNH